MPNIQLTQNEAATLLEILESSLNDIKTERVRTDNRAWRADLIQRESFVNDLTRRLANSYKMVMPGGEMKNSEFH